MFLRFILIFILVLIVLRLLGRLFLFSFIRSYNTRNDNRQYSDYRKEGDVTIDSYKTSQEKKIKKDIGDYVNYEEVKD